MPNRHAPDKEIITLFIPRPLAMKLRQMARRRGETLTDLCLSLFTRETQNVELSPEEYEAIAQAVRRAKRTGKVCATKHPRAPGH